MSPTEWYYARDDEQFGPVSSARLRQLAAAGGLRPDDLVWCEGMEDWVAAGNFKRLFEGIPPKGVEALPQLAQPVSAVPEAAPGLPPAPGPTALDRPRPGTARHLFDVLLDAVRAQFTAHFIGTTTRVFITCGHYGLYVAMLVCFCFTLILGVKEDSFNIILLGAIAVLILAVLQYAAGRFCESLDRLNRTTSGTISSMAFLDCFALLCMVLGLATLILAAVMAIQSGEYAEVVSGLVLFILCQYLAFIALNPETLSISVVPQARAGEEAIGVVSFLLKASLRLVPVAFGVGVVYGTLMLLYACYLVFDEKAMGELVEILFGFGPPMPKPYAKAYAAASSIIYYAALPFLAYLFFLLYYLAVDFLRAVLSIPGKLDALAEKKEE